MKHLVEFCKEKGIFGEVYYYINNPKYAWSDASFVEYIEEYSGTLREILSGTHDAREFFTYLLHWTLSPRGRNFWGDISRGWVDYCDEHNIRFLKNVNYYAKTKKVLPRT